MASTSTFADTIYPRLKQVYHEYRHTKHIPSKGAFFSPKCLQVCRPMPSYAALNRDTIVLYLVQSAGFKDVDSYESAQSSSTPAPVAESAAVEGGKDARGADGDEGEAKVKALGKGFYSIRPLKLEEAAEILAHDIVSPLGMTPSQLEALKQKEGWVGMRVELWDETEDGSVGRLIRVNYWWRQENVDGERKWLQCLHDIISIGERDGTEGLEGDVLE